MRNKQTQWLLYLGAFLLAWTHCRAEELPSGRQEVRLLTIGNSFADNALKYLPDIVEAAGDKLIYKRANLGGCSLERHWKLMKTNEADPADPEGKLYERKTKSLKEMLTAEQWDVVTIQQVSWLSHDLDTYEPYLGELIAYIRESAPQSKIMLQQIWAYRLDDPRFAPAKDGKVRLTHQMMYEQVREANHAMAMKYGIDILPSGDAMYRADTDSEMGFKADTDFDPKTAQANELPDEPHSLHRGYVWQAEKDQPDELILKYDGHHAGRNGEYLIGCVWFECLFGESVINNSYVPEGMDENYAAFLRETAHEAVEDLKEEGFLGAGVTARWMDSK